MYISFIKTAKFKTYVILKIYTRIILHNYNHLTLTWIALNLGGFFNNMLCLLMALWYDIIMEILDSLNEEQTQALLSIDGVNLVTAGAGTGKTRLLTHRIAYLINTLCVDPYNILAITFTNKAANEMKIRVEALVRGGNRVWISTFHSMCVRILWQDIEKLDCSYDRNFTIYSDTDTNRLLKQILKEFGIEDDVKNYEFHISNCKNKNMSIEAYENEIQHQKDADTIIRVFKEYEKNLKDNNALDFDDLLTKTYQLFIKCPDVLEFYSNRFEYVLVDEFQDTNKIQYDLVKLLVSKHHNLFVVGDEDQSIYSWRGADFTNIFNIKKDFAGTKVFKLERNYRCTKNILDSANKLISLNNERFDKQLWTDKESDNKVLYEKYYDEKEEAENVASVVYSLVARHGYKYSDIAILVRLNALTMPFEEKLLSYNIPHKIYGGFKFFERAEIKNILSYLRIFVNPKDEVSLLRIINFPKRSIGDSAVSSLKSIAIENGESVLNIILNIEKYPEAKGIYNKIKEFKDTYLKLQQLRAELPFDEFVIRVIEDFEIKKAYPNDNDDNLDKLLNIDQLISSVKSFMHSNPTLGLADWLESVTLQTDIDTMDDSDNVTIATIHAVKGLEFKVVFVVGMEDGIFPLSRAKENNRDLEEERRLAYVAFTRASERLYLSSCRTRFIYGRTNYEKESQFIYEAELAKKERPKYFFDDYDNKPVNNEYDGYSYNTKQNFQSIYIPKPQKSLDDGIKNVSSTASKEYMVGQIVGHPKFGVGTITSISADKKMADIDFGTFGKKTLMLDIAPLKIIKK